MRIIGCVLWVILGWITKADGALEIDAPDTLTIAEDELQPGDILANVTATGTSDPVNYIVSSTAFQLASSGDAIVLGDVPLDYETMDTKEIVVEISAEAGSDSATHTLIVTVTDGNDAPTFSGFDIPKGGYTIPSYVATGFAVGEAIATDEDQVAPNNEFTYEIETADVPFTINSDGMIVTDIRSISLTAKHVWPIVVKAVDKGTPPKSGTIIVPIAICNPDVVTG